MAMLISRERFLLVIDDALVMQVKKLTQDFQTVNNPTETSKAFDRQLPIEGFPSVPRLTAGVQARPVWYADVRYLAHIPCRQGMPVALRS